MHYVKATIQYAMTNPQDEGKKRYLDEDEGVIDTSPLDIPKPISITNPLVQNLSLKQILLSIQKDIKELEKSEYEKTVESALNKTTVETKPGESPPKYSEKLIEEVKKKNNLYPTKSPQRISRKMNSVASVTVLGAYVKNPKEKVHEQPDAVPVEKPPVKFPAAKIREKPIKRLERGLLMFKEIFVTPKENKLEELYKKERLEAEQSGQKEKKVECLTQRELPKKKIKGLGKTSKRKEKSIEDKELKEMLEEPENIDEKVDEEEVDEVVDIVMRMFNSKLKGRAGESFFSQQIQVQPPEGLNATVAAPLTPGGGWAPSIPSSTANLNKNSFMVNTKINIGFDNSCKGRSSSRRHSKGSPYVILSRKYE